MTPSSGPLLGPIQVEAPKEPIRIETAIKPVEAKPLEMKPVQIQLPTELKVTGSGMPEKIKVEWETKPVTLDLRWPKDPVKVTFDAKTETAESKLTELTQKVDKLESERGNDKKQINELNDKLTAQRDNYRDAIQRQLGSNNLTDAQVVQLMKEFNIQKIEWWGKPMMIFVWILISGILGGLAMGVVVSFEETRKRHEQWDSWERTRDLLAERAKISDNDKQRQAASDELRDLEADMEKFRERYFGSWKPLVADSVPAVILGIVAAFMVPGVLYFVPGKSLQAAAQNGYLMVSLCSICFSVAMVGELFIAAVLLRLRKLLQEW